ncbi:MAG: hypothetical protein V4684_01520 [Pseudomonadota bacterium]
MKFRTLALSLSALLSLGACSDRTTTTTVSAPATPAASAPMAAPASAPMAAPAAAPAGLSGARILDWGPRDTVAGTGFSVQPNGNSAIWFAQKGIGSSDLVEVWFGDTKLPGKVITPDSGGSAEIPPALLAKPGKYPVYLKTVPEGTRIEVGVFEVTAAK